jgi:hypothetical protein
MRMIFKAQLLLASISEAEQVVAALIRFERALRRKGFGPWYRLAHEVKATRRRLQEDAGLLTADEHVEKSPNLQKKSR